MAGMNVYDYAPNPLDPDPDSESDEEEEVPDVSILFEDRSITIPGIAKDFHSFVSSRGRDAEGEI